MLKNKILITCPNKIPPILAEEVNALGFTVKAVHRMGVETEGTFADTYKLNPELRSATRVLFLVEEFKAVHPDHLYKNIKQIPWERMILPSGYFSISSYVQNDYIKDGRFANLKAKDAIVDRFYELYNKRPDTGPDNTQTVLFLHWRLNNCSIYIDTSGETIAKHGYRKIPFKAPMLESLAAATIFATNWDKKSNFINPMCGSGTLAIEAALMGINKAPGLFRSNFGFMHVHNFERERWVEAKNGSNDKTLKKFPAKIIATDISAEAITAAKKNAETAGVSHLIDFKVCDFKETPIPPGGGVVMFNPEYGERLGEEARLEKTYKEIGDFFKQKCQGYRGYIFTGNMNLAGKTGLKTSRRIEFFNSNIECRLLEYELYEGTKRK